MIRPKREGRTVVGFSDFVAELKRRRVIRALLGYGIFSFAVLQVIEPVLHAYDLSPWVLTAVVTTLAAGFPVTVILAWLFDLTAEGVKRTPSVVGPTAVSLSRGSHAALLLGVGIVAALPGVAWYSWKGLAEDRATATAALAPPSIAVLPFADLSPNHDQDYFSDGVAEEILIALSKVQGLRVPGRASSFHFKGKNVEPAEIARRLGVANLLEGSVRRAGSRLRIMAEVVRADGERIWSQTFDRESTDIFALQDEIARAVVAALSPKLLSGVALPKRIAPTTSPDAYQLFLLGRSLSIQGTTETSLRAVSVLKHALQADPNFAAAYVWMGLSNGNLAILARGEESRRFAMLMRSEIDRAISLDPDEGGAYATRAWIRMVWDWDWVGAQADLDRAAALQPGGPLISSNQALLFQKLGKFSEAAALEREVVERDPLNAIRSRNLAVFLLNAGRIVEAREMLNRSLEISPDNPSALQEEPILDLLSGNAAKALEGFRKLSGPSGIVGVAAACHTLRREEESRAALTELEREHPDEPFLIAGAHGWRGDGDRAFQWLERAYQQHDLLMRNVKVTYMLAPIRDDPRYAAMLRKMNLPVD
jgi:TolB-like protein/Flp pilus assembly protein TadD